MKAQASSDILRAVTLVEVSALVKNVLSLTGATVSRLMGLDYLIDRETHLVRQ